MLIQRKEYVESYANFLGSIESERTERTSKSLTAMAESVVAIGYVLRDETVRLVETRSTSHNEVVTTNTRAFEDVIARLRRMHVEEVVRHRCDWAKREYEWRQLRHQRAIDEFHSMIESRRFVNPKERQDYFEKVRGEQRIRHEKREGIIFGMMKMTKDENGEDAPYSLTTKVVKAMSTEIEIVEKEEDELVDVVLSRLLVLAGE
jgi:hypothetical protein